MEGYGREEVGDLLEDMGGEGRFGSGTEDEDSDGGGRESCFRSSVAFGRMKGLSESYR
jgi:hypothetical protein